jgi:sporulation protein YlmC with PRC-barrel domain
MTLQTLLGKRVITTDSKRVGRVHDFKARREGVETIITHINVGGGVWIERLQLHGALRRLLNIENEVRLPWEAIGSVDKEIHLDAGWDSARCEEYRLKANERT